jgi:hypothetical protein
MAQTILFVILVNLIDVLAREAKTGTAREHRREDTTFGAINKSLFRSSVDLVSIKKIPARQLVNRDRLAISFGWRLGFNEWNLTLGPAGGRRLKLAASPRLLHALESRLSIRLLHVQDARL